jgi:hypothetical protein
MTIKVRTRTEPIAAHAYTLPVVREVPIAASSSAPPNPQPLAYTLDAPAW